MSNAEKVTARFYVSTVTKQANFANLSVTLLPVTRKAEDNVDWAKYTPSGKLEMNVSTDSPAARWFEDMLGKDVAMSFEAIDESTTQS